MEKKQFEGVSTEAKTKKRSLIAPVAAAALVAAISIGGTFAYFTYTTPATENHLTTSDGITAEVVEPSWDASKALGLVPGDTVAKDPAVANTSGNGGEKEYVAVEVEFQKSNGSGGYTTMSNAEVQDLLKVYAIYDDSITTPAAGMNVDSNWKQMTNTTADGKLYYYYNAALSSAADANSATEGTSKTTPLFDKVTLMSTASQSDLNNAAKDFKIVIKGAAIQAIDSETTVSAATYDAASGSLTWASLF